MPLQQLRNCNMGRTKGYATGSTGVGYAILDSGGLVVSPRTTTGVYEVASGSGIYAALVNFPDGFHGQLLWDTGTAFPTASFATEDYNVESNDPKVAQIFTDTQALTGSVQVIRDMTEGRWKIVANQMIFYAADNMTEVARFNLFDDTGTPSMDAVFERFRVP